MKNCFKKNYTASQQINDNTCAIEQIATDLDEYKTTTNNELDTLSNRIATNTNRIAGEANLRETADNNLQTQLNVEISARQSADQNLQQQINEIETGGQGDMKSTDYPNLVALENKLDMTTGGGYGIVSTNGYAQGKMVVNDGYAQIEAFGANSGSNPQDKIQFVLQAGNTPSSTPPIAQISYGNNFENVVDLLNNSGGLDATTQLIVDSNPVYTHINEELVGQYTARFRTGSQPPFTFSNDFTLTLPINITGTDGVVVDVAESSNAIEVRAETQKVSTTFANLFTELNNLTTQTKTIKSISFSPSTDISVGVTNFKLSSSGITTETSTDIVFLSGQSYVLYPSQLPDPNIASYAFNLQATGVRCGTLDIATDNISVQFARFWTPTTNDLNILFGNTQSIDTQISTESVVIEYE